MKGREPLAEMGNVARGYPVTVDLGEDTRQRDFLEYLQRVAQARFVMRKALRILDESAKSHGLDGMEHQALLQIAGTPSGALAIHKLADRLDIVPAFASRLVKQLESKELIRRSRPEEDRRVILTSISPKGMDVLRKIDSDIHYEIAHFQRGIDRHDRAAALAIFGFYVGEPVDSAVAKAIREMLGP
jgi:DNA-binding MarR family transcriptional regulator